MHTRLMTLKFFMIYEIAPEVLARETIRQLDISRNEISHVGFTMKWAEKNGRCVFSQSVEDE
jgi:hypothetical protein